jgi:hypothetical protein
VSVSQDEKIYEDEILPFLERFIGEPEEEIAAKYPSSFPTRDQ